MAITDHFYPSTPVSYSCLSPIAFSLKSFTLPLTRFCQAQTTVRRISWAKRETRRLSRIQLLLLKVNNLIWCFVVPYLWRRKEVESSHKRLPASGFLAFINLIIGKCGWYDKVLCMIWGPLPVHITLTWQNRWKVRTIKRTRGAEYTKKTRENEREIIHTYIFRKAEA